jgi:hypothetical protein
MKIADKTRTPMYYDMHGIRQASRRVQKRTIAPAAVISILMVLIAFPLHAQTKTNPASKSSGQQTRPGLTFMPYVLFSTRYDDNIFTSTSDPQSDTILNLTPGFGMLFSSPRTHFKFDYSFTARKYARHSDLSSWTEAQGGTIGVNHWFTQRFNAGIHGGYFVTHNPGRLTPEAGVVLGRHRATRAELRPELTYKFSPLTWIEGGYGRSRTELTGGRRTDIGMARAILDHELTERDSLRFRYENVDYDFQNDGGATSNLFTLGWSRAISRRANLFLSAGPRDTEGRVVPEILARIRYESKSNTYSLSYRRTQLVVVGQSEVIDARKLTAAMAFTPSRHWSITLSPSYYHSDAADVSISGYHLGFYVWYRLTRHLSIGLTEDYRLQHGRLDSTDNPTVRRNVVGISLRWGLPFRGGNFRRGEQPEPLQRSPNQRPGSRSAGHARM